MNTINAEEILIPLIKCRCRSYSRIFPAQTQSPIQTRYPGMLYYLATGVETEFILYLEDLCEMQSQNLYLCFLQSTTPRNSGLVIHHKHKCSQCHRSYARLYALRVHEATHRGRYPYWCKVCGKGFSATSNLRGHMAQHTGVVEFKCDICGRQFRYPQHIKRHLEQHSK